MKSTERTIDVEELLAYYTNDDGFQFWLGPSMPDSDPHKDLVMDQIKKIFQSRSIIRECIDRHRSALVGKRPHWYFTNAEGDRIEDSSASDAELLMQSWIDRQYRLAISQESQLQDSIAECTKNMLVVGRGYLRVWSPLRFSTSADPTRRVCLHSPHPSSVVINRDDDFFVESIEYTYTSAGVQRKEVQTIDPITNLTIFTTLDENGQVIADETFTLDLGGSFSVFEMRSPSLVTASVRQAQNALQYTMTVMLKAIEVGGFRERLILGAQPPGRWDENGKFIADAQFTVGPGQTSFVQGVPMHDEVGQLRGYTSPSVSYAEPVSPQTFIDTAQAFVAVVYHEMKQSHLLGSDLQLSGVSREQARQDFETSLKEHSVIVEAALSGIYASALLMMTQPELEKYRGLNPMVQLRLSASSPLPEERAQILAWQQAGLLSRATAMSLSGYVDDSDGEESLLAEEERDRTVVEDASTLLTVGAIDQPAAITLLKQRGRLKDDVAAGDGNEVLNGNGASAK